MQNFEKSTRLFSLSGRLRGANRPTLSIHFRVYQIYEGKNEKIITVGLAAMLLAIGGCAHKDIDNNQLDLAEQITPYVEELVSLNEVPGLALVVIHKGAVVYENYYGVSALDTREAVSEETVFRIYSMSKIMAAVAIFDLIEQRKLSLDAPLSAFFDDIPEDWATVTVGHMLAHASGLPDIRTLTEELADETLSEDDFFKLIYAQERQYQTGDDWSYTQTNYLLLKRILEKLTGKPFEAYLRSRQFPKIGATRVIFSSSDFDEISKRAKNYKYNVETSEHERKLENYGPRNNVLAGLNLTLRDLIDWSQAFDQNQFLIAKTKKVMWTPFNYTKSDKQFLYGWDVYPVADQISYGFTGGGVSGLRKFPNHDLTIIVLTNGFKYYSVHNTVINHVAGMVDPALENKPIALARMYQHDFLKTKTLDVEELYDRTANERPELDAAEVMTSFGYKLFDIREANYAVKVFEVIAERNPTLLSAHESLGHAYLSQGNMPGALAAFEDVIEISPNNSDARRMVQEICDRIDDATVCQLR